MRIIVFFDLPVQTGEDRRNYARFRKHLIKSGFVMVQESVYSKLVLNASVANAVIENVRKNKAPSGIIQMMMVTEKQYAKMEFVTGEAQSQVLETDERLVVI